jgi:hypothetical protein
MFSGTKVIGQLAHLAVAVYLLFKANEQYVFSPILGRMIASAILVIYLPVACIRLLRTRRACAARAWTSVIAGASVLLSLALVVKLTFEIHEVRYAGWASKEMRWDAFKKNIPAEASEQRFKDVVEHARSDRNSLIVLSLVLGLLYWGAEPNVFRAHQAGDLRRC